MDILFAACLFFGLIYLCVERVDRPASYQTRLHSRIWQWFSGQAVARMTLLRSSAPPKRTGSLYVHLGSSM